MCVLVFVSMREYVCVCICLFESVYFYLCFSVLFECSSVCVQCLSVPRSMVPRLETVPIIKLSGRCHS